MDEQENPLEKDHSLCVVLPGGLERKATVHGSKPVMDLLVTLCASYRLNPSDYTVEVLSPNKNNISFKPNSPIGSLEAEKIVLKPKGLVEEKNIKLPYMPEATVRLLINYNKSHKAVVRVSPRVPLDMLLPVVCDKCEFKVETTILLRDSLSEEPLDLNKTLNEHELREVFARDTADDGFNEQQHIITPESDLPKMEKKQKENTGFLSLFRRKKKRNELERAASAPASPGRNKQVAVSLSAQGLSCCNDPSADVTKKRRAPQPPMGTSQSVPYNLSICHLRGPQRYAESSLRRTKRRAPPPPCTNAHPEQQDTQRTGAVDSLNTLEELSESDESDSVNLSLSSSSSPCSSKPQLPSSSSLRPSLAHLHDVAEPYLLSLGGKEISDARCALANILMSSVSKGMLVKRLRNSATFPKLHSGSSCVSVTGQCPDNGVFCAELDSVLSSQLPTESEWEDPGEKKGMTTFQVVPLKKHESQVPKVDLEAPDPCQETAEDDVSEASLENNQTEAEEEEEEEEMCSPTTSETQTPLPNQEAQAVNCPDSHPPPHLDIQGCPASPLCEVEDTEDTDERLKVEDEGEVTSEVTPAALSDHSEEQLPCGARIDSEGQSDVLQSPRDDLDWSGSPSHDKEVEEEVGVLKEEEAEEDMFPSPPPPIFFNEDLEVTEETREDAASSLPASQPATTACNEQTDACGEDHHDESAPKPPDKTSAAPSRFAQAVALAVQRSRLQREESALEPQSPSGPRSTLASTYQYGV